MSVVGSILEETTKGNTLHVLQWIAVEADDEDTATQKVETRLEEELNPGFSWFDWFIVGGGRWNPEQYQYKSSSNMVISYDRDPNAFRGKVDELIANRIDTYNQHLAEVKKHDVIAKLDNYGGVMEYDHVFYYLRSVVKMKSGDWTYDSEFYDLEAYSSNATHLLSKLDKHDLDAPKTVTGIFLVPVYFHF